MAAAASSAAPGWLLGFPMSSSVGDQPDATHLAMDRTWLSHERTLMAWVRTATSMISFGFTIYKFFEFGAGQGWPVTRGRLTPRGFALFMITTGLVALAIATISHRAETRSIAAALGKKHSAATIVAALLSVLGIVTLLATLFRS
jgi:putative membrane protein